MKRYSNTLQMISQYARNILIIMGRRKHEQYWNEVTKEEGGSWKCKRCNGNFSGSVSRIRAHVDRIPGKGIAVCSNEAVNNMVSLSSNSLQNARETSNIIGSTSYQNNIESIHILEDAGETSNIIGSTSHQNNIESIHILEAGPGSANETSININISFEREIIELNELICDLKNEEDDIKEQVKLLESRGKKPKGIVDIWLNGSQDLRRRAHDTTNLKDQLIKKMQEHKENKPMVLSAEFVGKDFEEKAKKIWKLLKNDKVFLICIYGMGGVGKTFLITEVVKEIRRKGSFKEIIWVTVSEDYSISKLQDYIADRIGIKLDAMEWMVRERAEKLSLELQTREKTLFILDDVWKYIDLEKVGIPPPMKVVMTSRLQHVCEQMDCPPDNMIKMDCLSFEEIWELFLLKLGQHETLSPEVEEIAENIVRRCNGLPLATCVMARMMKGLNGIHQWKHALNKLENLEMREEMEEEVFKVLKRSYDNLVDKKMQNCFLYCILLIGSWEQFENFYFERSVMMLVENGLIKGMRSLEEIFDEGHTILDKLQAHSLLVSHYHYYYYEEGGGGGGGGGGLCQIHPMVRDMACHILKDRQRDVMMKFKKRFTESEWTNDLEWVFLSKKDIEEIPEGMSPCCPRLSNLILSLNHIPSIPECFFLQMNALAILDLSYNSDLKSLPDSLSNLSSLISLDLAECVSLEYVPPLGKLQNLSRLDISHCSIEKVPEGLEKLIKLKWLDLSRNETLWWEPGSVLPNLTYMQFLDLRCTEIMLTINDVHGMTTLECFRGYFLDSQNYNHYVQTILDRGFGPKTYHLHVGNICTQYCFDDHDDLYPFDPNGDQKIINFGNCKELTHCLPRDTLEFTIEGNDHWKCLCNGLSFENSCSLTRIEIHRCTRMESLCCLTSTCSLRTDHVTPPLSERRSMFSHLKQLSVRGCNKIEKLLTPGLVPLLQNLEEIYIWNCSSMKEIFAVDNDDGSRSERNMFSHLKKLSVWKCHKIEKLLTPGLVLLLQNLEEIHIMGCSSMKEIFAVGNGDDDDDGSNITLPKLTKLYLRNLPELKIVCKGILLCALSKSWPSYHHANCPNLKDPTIQTCNI